MKAAPEQYRIKNDPILGSDSSYGNNGAFRIPHPNIMYYYFNVIISDGMGWEHVSVSLTSTKRKVERCPTWSEMCFIKDLFWSDDECVIQFHPPKSEYVSNHPYCLHLWKPTFTNLPLPDSTMVGIKQINIQK